MRGRLWIAAGVVLLVVVAAVVWLGLSWKGTYDQAVQTQADVGTVRDAATAEDWQAALDGLPAAAASAAELAAQTQSGQWRLLESLPVVSDTAVATRTLAVTLDDVLASVEPLEPFARRVLDGQLRDASGRIDLTAVGAVAPLLRDLGVSLDLAQERLASVETAGVREPVAAALGDFADVAGEYGPTVSGAADVLERVPGLLGSTGERRWLVLLQNPAEARGTGGFVGGYAVVTADGGQLAIESAGTSADLAGSRIPVDGVPEEDRIMWGPYLTSWSDYNLSPDFPLTARQSVAGMAERGVDVDGVLALDPAVVAAIMRATGPVKVGDQTVTADDVERFFLVDVYRDYPDAAERDRVSMQIVQAVLASVLGANPDARSLVEALGPVVEQGRVKAWSADEDEQAWLAATEVGGALPDERGPVVAVTFNNSAGNKLDAFMTTGIEYRLGMCPTAKRQSSSLRVTLRNDAPTDLPGGGNYGRIDVTDAPEGSTSMLVHLYLPVDSFDEVPTLDGEPVDMYPEIKGGRLAWWLVLPIERGQERTLEMSFTEPSVAGVEPRVIAQPMAVPTSVSVVPDDAC